MNTSWQPEQQDHFLTQQVLGASGYYADCRLWNSANAWFDPCAHHSLRAGICAASIAVLILWLISYIPGIPTRPLWARNFVEEPIADGTEADAIGASKSKLPYHALCLALLSLLEVVASSSIFYVDIDQWNVAGLVQDFLACALTSVCSIIYIAIVIPRVPSPTLSLLRILALLQNLADHSRFIKAPVWYMGTASAVISIAILFCMPMRNSRLLSDGISKPGTPPTSSLRTPEDDLTFFQWLTVSWMWPLIKEGRSRQLQFEDVWSLGYHFGHSRLHEAFRALRGSVFKRLVVANGVDLLITTVTGSIESLANLAKPVLLQKLLQSMTDSQSPKYAALIYAVLALLVRLLAASSFNLDLWYSRRAYERSRGEMITMLYEKTLARKVVGEALEADENGALNEPASTGKILNIMRGDAYEVAQRFWEWPKPVTEPLELVVSFVLVWTIIGWPSLVGIGFVLTMQMLTAVVTNVLISYEYKKRGATDDKLKIVTQFIEAIRHLRYNSWESKWLDAVLDARQKELVLLVKTGLLGNLIAFLNNLASSLFPVLVFFAFTSLAGQPLRVDVAFPALQLFRTLEGSLRELPSIITGFINAWVALGRIEDFMHEPELNKSGIAYSDLEDTPGRLEIADASFAWPGRSEPVLRQISLDVMPGLTVVFGKVGSGKTAFLRALLGESDLLSGSYTQPRAVIAYCSQTPWLQHMTIRDNILFGRQLEMDRYRTVLSACALTSDLATFADEDLSFVGENGIGLSGGQKARVALARAVYSRAPYLLLDDPISALDQQTAEHIMKECIASPLCKERTVVLVTHRLDLTENLAQHAIEIQDGQAFSRDVQSLRATLKQDHGQEASESSMGNNTTPKLDRNAGHGKDTDAVEDKFIEEEKRAHGGVKFNVYWRYIRAGKLRWWCTLIVCMVILRLVTISQTWLLKDWGEKYDTISIVSWPKDPFKDFPAPDEDLQPWLIALAVLAIGLSVFSVSADLLIMLITYCAGKQLFTQIMQRVSNAAFRFYDITPVGRLMNRMTSDIGVIDGSISEELQFVALDLFTWAASVVVIMSVTPVFLAFAIITTGAFVAIFAQFLPTSQNLRRLEMVSLSPLMANFGTLIEGLVTVRAFKAQRRFQEGVVEVVDTFQKMDHFYWSLQAWLMIRFDTVAAFLGLAITLLAIYTDMSAGLTAFVLAAAAQFIRSTHSLCREYGQLELDFTSVERVIELLHVEQEPQGELQPPAAWPTSGEIIFDQVNVRYAEHLDFVLKDISLEIPGGSNVAIIGRTGSGKSTLALALLATVRPTSGTILLDNIDICAIQPSELRKRITFLAQEPTLFVGSMRQNLDPLEDFSDEECTGVLKRLCGQYGWSLETRVEAGGKNLSQGQRQLVQLARAVLRRSPLVILDEATASIDLGTSMEVQDILRQEMAGSTMLTIAHRVEAVSNADWYIELKEGKVVAAGKARG